MSAPFNWAVMHWGFGGLPIGSDTALQPADHAMMLGSLVEYVAGALQRTIVLTGIRELTYDFKITDVSPQALHEELE